MCPVRAVEEFEVDSDWVLPPVIDLVPDGGRLDQEVRSLDNTYFDTPGAGLRLFGITLRRRVGGAETGWQLKAPNGTVRTELKSSSRAKTLPPALAKGVTGLLAGERLDPVAVVMTTRTAYRVLNSDGELVLEIADDQVESGPPDGESTLHSWREVEVELGPAGKRKGLKRARKLLRAAGATPSTLRTKLDRALESISSDGDEPAAAAGTVGELMRAYVAAQCDVLASNDVGLRTGAPVVHQSRVAARRLRSTLRVFERRSRRRRSRRAEQRTGVVRRLAWPGTRREVLAGRLTSSSQTCRWSRSADRSRPRSPRPSQRNETMLYIGSTTRCALGATNT